ncbi:MAG TPA: beta-ketoacyl-[acyl-carrier-protein] synthase family protein, partial [Nitrospirae bacterium]|nr:beta-ketoacyl-[acyl-carrier-protein] synthase family protein [Nitrospirota bacterium]
MRRAVITGAGVLCSTGKNLEHYWNSLSEGICGIGEITLFDTSGFRGKPGAEVRDEYINDDLQKEKRLSRCDMLGLSALDEAVKSSGLDLHSLSPGRIATVMGGGSGGLLSGEMFRKAIANGKKASPSLLVPFSSSSFTDLAASRCNSRGFRTTVSTACSSSSTAIGIAMDLIIDDMADVVITGGSESLSETTFAGFNSLRLVDEVPCRPFDKERKGISLGEGAAIFIIEEAQAAARRGARIIGEIAGYGITGDANHVTAPDPEGSGMAYAVELAIENAGISTGDIDYINAHGTGTHANDLAEVLAIKSMFGNSAYTIPISSTKSMIGHCLGAAGSLEASASLLPLVRGIIPPTANYKNRDPECNLNIVSRAFKSS